jgi:spore germination cell wall hydrolase CwlJ-like protein
MFKKVITASSLLLLSGVASARDITPPPYADMQGKRLSSVECLAANSYHEGRSESDIANIMIMATVINRVNDKRFPDDICDVVFQNKAFSWTSDGKSDKIKNLTQYRRLYKLAETFLINRRSFLKLSQKVNHYHTTKVKPYWSTDENMKYVTTIDNHRFYSW